MAYQNIYVDQSQEQRVVYVWDDTKGMIVYPEKDFRYAYVADPSGNKRSMTGQRVSKTTRFTRNHPSIFESDLPMETRVLTDLYLNEDTVSTGNVTLFVDIEVSMKNQMPIVKEGNNEITSIAMMDSVSNRYMVFVLDTQGIHEDFSTDEADILFYPSEEELLLAFLAAYELAAPTIVTGWNSNGFDVPYLYNRICRVLGSEEANRLSPIGKVKYSDRLERYRMAGVSSLDYLELYRKFTYTQRPNYRLDTIGRLEVDMGKVDYVGSLDMLFRDDIHKFIEYNLQDVRIIVELDKKLKLIELVRGICHIGHVPYEDYNMSSRFLEGTVVTYLHRKGIVVTNKPYEIEDDTPSTTVDIDDDEDDEGFIGAYVKEPIPGLYDWVYSLDLESLYPSIIMSLNISPETKVGYVRNFNVEQHIRKEILAYVVQEPNSDDTVEMEYKEFTEFLDENSLRVASNGVLYNTSVKGIIPEILEEWFKLRKEYKNLMIEHANAGNKELESYYDQRQHIQKIFLNSMYGYLGLVGARFYDLDNASAVTLTGQDVIKSSALYANKQYQQKYKTDKDYCIYVDTDSLYLHNPDYSVNIIDGENGHEDPLTASIASAFDMERKLNSFYDIFAKRAFNCDDHRFRIKGESVARKGLWLAKKRYVLDKVYDLEKNAPTSKKMFKGVDVVRSSFPKAFKIFMTQMFNDILAGVGQSKIDSDVLTLKSQLPTLDFLDIAKNTSANNLSKFLSKDGVPIKGTPAHIKACISHNKLITYFNIKDKFDFIRDGEKVKCVYLRKNPLRIASVAIRGYQDPPEIVQLINDYIDLDAIFDSDLKKKLQYVYDALGWGLIPTKVNQNASEFFSF